MEYFSVQGHFNVSGAPKREKLHFWHDILRTDLVDKKLNIQFMFRFDFSIT